MGFFRRSDEPTAREAFLVSALAAVGISAENIKEAEDKKATDFLKVLDRSDAVRAELDAKISALTGERDASASSHSAFVAALEANGFTKDQIVSPDALKAATESLIKTRAEELAVEISAARGIKPVGNAPSADVQTKTVTYAEFSAMAASEKMKFSASGGKIVD